MHLVAAAIIQRGDRVLLGLRPMRSPLPGAWEFPGGKVEPHETAEQCLVRELQEELRISVRVTAPFMESSHAYAHGAFRVLSFRVVWVSGAIEPQIHDRVEWVRVDELLHYNLIAADVPIAAALAAATIEPTLC